MSSRRSGVFINIRQLNVWLFCLWFSLVQETPLTLENKLKFQNKLILFFISQVKLSQILRIQARVGPCSLQGT